MLVQHLHFFATRLQAESNAYVRVCMHFADSFVLLANAADSEFSTSSPELSARFLDILETQIATSIEDFDVSKIIEKAVTSWRSEFPEAALWITCMCIGSDTVRVFWASGDEIWIRQGRIASRKTVRHTLGQKCLPLSDMLVNGFGPEYQNSSLESAEFTFNPAVDTVVILGWKTVSDAAESDIAAHLIYDELSEYLQHVVKDSVDAGSAYGLAVIIGEYVESSHA